ncbi:apolipoprotein N-acyltransferase [Sphingomicrobium aestuariivivum]|uniref:apolipoprotein N-acyltransferase n=1 Tax=Sphingomicrobium aestuariivivum TaxID=1582356 RepID=UPI001FD69C27|nr:apolipoprotein N-acyltransferase [Sphingomicrobium aestuariivivum]MCJ8191684.1 apolipoprotein N-acyltransferase [Sphingomicrobium aestuariivivum]
MPDVRAIVASHRAAPSFAFVLGLVGATGFEPLGLWPLLLLSLAGLLALLQAAQTAKRAALLGWLYGVGQFALGLNWIATAFTFQSNMPAWLGWIAVALLSLYLAVFPMLAALGAWWLSRRQPIALGFVFAGLWIVGEWLRATLFTGFAWNPLSVALVPTPLLRLAPLVGTYALSGITVLIGAALWWLVLRRFKASATVAVALLLVLLIPQERLVHQDVEAVLAAAVPPPPEPVSDDMAPPPAPPPLDPATFWPTIRIVQPNIGQADKWRAGYDSIAADRLSALTLKRASDDVGPPMVIFWPEAAITKPTYDERESRRTASLFERLRATRGLVEGQTLVTGGIGVESADRRTVDAATNSIFMLDHDGSLDGRYDKAHLVPYGEYLPMRSILEPIGLSRLAPGAYDFSPGPGPRSLPLPHRDLRMGLQVCYEIIFSGQVVDPADRPDVVFNPSNDAWFGAWGPPQHLGQARLRAAEEGLPVIRATPTGISALIDAKGDLLATIPSGTEGHIDALLPRALAPTPFARLGNWLALIAAAAFALTGIALARRPR